MATAVTVLHLQPYLQIRTWKFYICKCLLVFTA